VTDIRHIAAASCDYTRFDAVVVGSGPSGSIAARTLAEKGWRVAVLEYGGVVSPGALYRPHQEAYSKALTSPLGPPDGNPWTACCVGGGMQFYCAITLRYRQADLSASRYLSTDLAIDWPITLEELEPHYEDIERLLGIGGAHGWPHYPISQRGQLLCDAMQELGMQPKRLPLAIRPPETEHGCNRCSACNELVCPTGAKASVLARQVLDDAHLPGTISVLHGCFVHRIETTHGGNAHALECFVPLTAERMRIPVERVIVCANAIQSAALMLRSASKHAPQGIGNEHGLVGRGLSFKISGYSVGQMKQSGADAEAWTAHWGPHATVFTDAFYEHADVPCGLGGLIYDANFVMPHKNAGTLRLHYIAGEEPWSHNRVVLDESVDRHGVPYIRFEYKNSANDRARIDFLADRADDVLRRLGARHIQREPRMHAKGSSHLHGTLRAGTNPATSVVDRGGKVHGFANIHVMDGSVMNFAGNSNPTHTIMANARRMALSLT